MHTRECSERCSAFIYHRSVEVTIFSSSDVGLSTPARAAASTIVRACFIWASDSDKLELLLLALEESEVEAREWTVGGR